MPHIFKDFIIISLLVAIGLGFLVFDTLYRHYPSQLSSVIEVEQKLQPLPDGTLIKASGDERVYYIENGKKRWIESKEVFRLQGFRSEDIKMLTANEVASYENGEQLTGQSNVVLPEEISNLPDLIPLPVKSLRLKKIKDRTVLKFTASFGNQGKRHFELATSQETETRNGETYQPVHQLIARKDGTYRNKVVGNFAWHASHEHYHYSDFADYVFSFIKPAPGTLASNAPKTIRQKTTFCIRDNEPLSLTIPGAPKKAIFPTCGKDKQGVSIGWIDIYKNTLPDQYIDVNDMPAGIYSLSFFLDPNQRFAEEHKNNNISTIFLNLDVKNNMAKIIAAAAPFTTALNNFPDKTLIRAGGEGKVYVTQNNKRRPLNDPVIFDSYGYSWNDVFTLTQNMIDSIPTNNLVRLQGNKKVYTLNNHGYKRHILNPEIFYSYGFTTADVADINQIEFSSYLDSSLIRRTGNNEVYSVDGVNKKKIGTVGTVQSLGYNLDAIHTVNEKDFDSYITAL